MKKQGKQTKRQVLVLNRETLRGLNDNTLKSIAGGCGGMPPTCPICADNTF